jgi:dCTP deaminase
MIDGRPPEHKPDFGRQAIFGGTLILSDAAIQEALRAGELAVEPYEPNNLQPASLDLRLGDGLWVFRSTRGVATPHLLDPTRDNARFMEPIQFDGAHPYILEPNAFALGVALERITLSQAYVGRLEGKSSLGRLGLLVHVTAGYADPGYCGNLTLELKNLSPYPFKLTSGMPIAQLAFERLARPSSRPYQGKYQGDTSATPARLAPV